MAKFMKRTVTVEVPVKITLRKPAVPQDEEGLKRIARSILSGYKGSGNLVDFEVG